MKTTIVDLSKPIQYNAGDPWFMRVKIKHKAHRKSHWLIRLALRLPARLFPKNWTGWADDTIKNMGLHATTHIDAPWHYGPVVEGKPAKTIDQIPLEWCYGDGIVIDCTHKEDFVAITVDDLKKDLDKNGITIQEGNIVLIRTDRDKMVGTSDFVEKGTGMSKEATEWLIDQGVKVMGIDQWGWDLPLKFMAKKAKEIVEEPLEKKLWKAADKLRKNMDAAEYKHVALGLIFLKYISDAFEEQYQKLVALKK